MPTSRPQRPFPIARAACRRRPAQTGRPAPQTRPPCRRRSHRPAGWNARTTCRPAPPRQNPARAPPGASTRPKRSRFLRPPSGKCAAPSIPAARPAPPPPPRPAAQALPTRTSRSCRSPAALRHRRPRPLRPCPDRAPDRAQTPVVSSLLSPFVSVRGQQHLYGFLRQAHHHARAQPGQRAFQRLRLTLGQALLQPGAAGLPRPRRRTRQRSMCLQTGFLPGILSSRYRCRYTPACRPRGGRPRPSA